MKITILVPNAAKEILPRVRVLYRLLEKDFELEVISIVKKREETDHFKNEFKNFKKVIFDLGTVVKDLRNSITGDIIYALKAKPSSFGMAMSLKGKKKLKVIVDIDAREIYNCYPYSDNMLKNFSLSLLQFNNHNSFIYTWMLEKRIKYADNLTVSSSVLQKIYGGTLIYGACDTELFNSKIYKRDEIREQMKWENYKIILLTGNNQDSKEIELIIQAIKSTERNDLKLVIVGEKTKYLDKLAVKEPVLSLLGFQPQQNVAKLLSASDLVILTQKNVPATRGIVPLRLFEAMASSKPVIASDISDFPVILDGCGFIYKEGDILSLKNNIEKVFNEPEVAMNLAEKARSKCIDKYSEQFLSKKLVEFFKKFETN